MGKLTQKTRPPSVQHLLLLRSPGRRLWGRLRRARGARVGRWRRSGVGLGRLPMAVVGDSDRDRSALHLGCLLVIVADCRVSVFWLGGGSFTSRSGGGWWLVVGDGVSQGCRCFWCCCHCCREDVQSCRDDETMNCKCVGRRGRDTDGTDKEAKSETTWSRTTTIWRTRRGRRGEESLGFRLSDR